MKFNRKDMKRFLIIIILCVIPVYGAGEDLVSVGRIEILGLVNLDRTDILGKVRTGVRDNKIIIDLESLKRELESNILISGFNFSSEPETLIISIREKYPVFNLMIVDENQSTPYLIDSRLNILESGRFFKTDMPIIIADRELFDKGAGKKIVSGIITILSKVKEDISSLSGELTEITIYSPDELRVTLKNRGTLFILKNRYSDYLKLEKTAAFLDKRGNYPESLDLREDMILVR